MSLLPTYARFNINFARGEGARLWDEDGREYLDFLSGIGVCNTGHCHPHVVAAVQEQAASLMHVSNLFHTEPATRLAARLSERSLGGGVFFCNSGAEANEAAIKLARKRRRGGDIVVALGAFHGRTYGALSATPQEAKQAPFAPLVAGFRAVAAEAIADAVDESTAAVLVEPIQGESGVLPIDPGHLRAMREACDAAGALLIFDEVQCGMGRTGTLFAHEAVGVRPDAMTLAKGLGGGFPIGALVTTPACADVLEPGDHGTTFGGSPLACAAANAALDVLDDPALLERVRELGARMSEALAETPGVQWVRGRGLMLAAEMRGNALETVKRVLFEHRLVINATDPHTLRFLPPLIVSEAEIDDAVDRVRLAQR